MNVLFTIIPVGGTLSYLVRRTHPTAQFTEIPGAGEQMHNQMERAGRILHNTMKRLPFAPPAHAMHTPHAPGFPRTVANS
jgi:hypothetical protein